MPPKRAAYTSKFKLQVIKFAEESNNWAAGREFGVNEKLVRDWRKVKDVLEKMPRKKCANGGKVCSWPAIEEKLFKVVTEQRQSGFIVTRNSLRLKAKSIAKEDKVTGKYKLVY